MKKLLKKYSITLNRSILIVNVLIIAALVVPFAILASRRHHSYHSSKSTRNVKFTPTPIIATQSAEITGDNLLTGQWNYLAGATLTEDGLNITPTDLSIVSQDGVENIPNPPINLAGTYLKGITGNLVISASMFIPKSTTATMQLYGNPPVIADEFRVERPSLQMALSNGQLDVKVWNGTNQIPSSQTFSVPMDGTIVLSVTRQQDSTQLMVNDTVIGTVKTPTLYTSGNLWFGFDSKGGDWNLTNLTAIPQNGGTFQLGDGSAIQIADHSAQGLQALASKKRPGFLVGEAMALGPIVSDPLYAAVAMDSAMFGSITPENDMKMINLQPQQGVFTFQKADALVKIAQQNGVNDIHGHTLVFAEANPAWFNAMPVKTAADKAAVEKVMIDHITTVVKHFGDKVTSWDVVNEPIADYDDFDADSGRIYRNHKWYQAMGSSYIIKAFEAAYKANPNALLSVNEYGLEEDGERWDTFLKVMKQLSVDLKSRNIPLDHISVGFQSHVYESGDQIDAEVLRNHIQTLAVLGFKSQISEMDVYNDDGDTVQAEQYTAVFDACISEPSCVAWRGWTLSDKYDFWMDDDGSIESGIDGLFSTKLQPRPGLTAIRKILGNTSISL